jgi:CheY-like chemotaxis protein
MNSTPTDILLIEDENAIINLVKLTFADPAYSVTIARTVTDGIARATEAPPDILLLDIRLPERKADAGLLNPWGGIEVYKALRQNPETQETPIIVFTAVPSPQMEAKAKLSQIDVQGYVYKPFNEDELLEAVSAVLNSEGRGSK